jgi:hypothetical protein
MATVGTWLKRVGIVTGVGLGGTAIFLAMPNREKSPIRHPSVFNWVNLGADKMYYYCGASMRKFVDPETGHEQAIKLAGYPRAVRGVLGFLPVQFDYANLKTAPFERQQRENAAAAAGNGGILGSTSGSPFPISSSSPSSSSTPPLKSLYFHSPIGLAAGFDKNAEAIDGLLDMGFGFVGDRECHAATSAG